MDCPAGAGQPQGSSVIRFKMEKSQIIIITIIVVSTITGVIGRFVFQAQWGLFASLPALTITGLAAMGHLVTLDDDMPGGWSNTEEDKKFWYSSLKELSIKIIVFIVLCILLIQ